MVHRWSQRPHLTSWTDSELDIHFSKAQCSEEGTTDHVLLVHGAGILPKQRHLLQHTTSSMLRCQAMPGISESIVKKQCDLALRECTCMRTVKRATLSFPCRLLGTSPHSKHIFTSGDVRFGSSLAHSLHRPHLKTLPDPRLQQ